MAILNTSGSAVVSYTYDAWGKLYSTTGALASTLGEANPLTYRGYVYDQDSGYYYLQSRYYDPEVGRFINADAYATTGTGLLGNNMYVYCNNNSVNLVDFTGTLPFGARPMQVAMNDGGYIKNHTETDGDPKSADLAARYISIPKADGTVNSYVKRDGYYIYDPSNTTNYLLALGGLACLLIPSNIDDILFATQGVKLIKTLFHPPVQSMAIPCASASADTATGIMKQASLVITFTRTKIRVPECSTISVVVAAIPTL